VYDFHAAAGSAVNAAISGLESFANHHIARVGGAGAAVVYDGGTYPVSELWNWTLDDRLGKVLPELWPKRTPKQESWWPTLKRVQGLAALTRHGVIDPVERSGLTGKKSLAQRFCDAEYGGGAAMMLHAMAHFAPTWISAERLSQLPPAP